MSQSLQNPPLSFRELYDRLSNSVLWVKVHVTYADLDTAVDVSLARTIIQAELQISSQEAQIYGSFKIDHSLRMLSGLLPVSVPSLALWCMVACGFYLGLDTNVEIVKNFTLAIAEISGITSLRVELESLWHQSLSSLQS